jgi:hypothetical protein
MNGSGEITTTVHRALVGDTAAQIDQSPAHKPYTLFSDPPDFDPIST